jgi:uncharacterized membrane protein YqhA
LAHLLAHLLGTVDAMLHILLSFRWVTLVAAFGTAVGALLMFVEGCAKLFHAIATVVTHPGQADGPSVVAPVMQATDAFLFGLVLIVFAYAITFGFAFDLPKASQTALPRWMRLNGISELKFTLIEVILVYLVVDFTTDMVELDMGISWTMLVKPGAILLIAAALRVLGNGPTTPGPNGPS